MPPKYSAQVLPSVLKLKKAVMCLMEKTCVLEKVQSGMTYSTSGHELNANKLVMYIQEGLFK